jgi:hypothetical protein
MKRPARVAPADRFGGGGDNKNFGARNAPSGASWSE